MTRDEIIQKKLEELESKKTNLEAIIKECSVDYKTNLKLTLGNDVYSLRTVNNLENLVGIFSRFLGKVNNIEKAVEILRLKDSYNFKIGSFSYSDWEDDFKKLAKKLEAQEELNVVEKGILELPKFYSKEKKDDDEFNSLLNSLG